MVLGKRTYASLPFDCRSEQLNDITILENTRVPTEITIWQQLSISLAMFWVEPRHQRPQSASASRFTGGGGYLRDDVGLNRNCG